MAYWQTPTGRRTQRVTLATVTRIADGDGGYTETLVALDPADWFVAIDVPAPSDERIAGRGVQASNRSVMHGPYRADVSTATVITKPGTAGRPDRHFAVRGVGNPDEADLELVLDVEEA